MNDYVIGLLREWASGDFTRLECRNRGICDNLEKANYTTTNLDMYDLVRDVSLTWPKSTQLSYHPVPNDTRFIPLWENPDRLELCTFIADYLENNPEFIYNYVYEQI